MSIAGDTQPRVPGFFSQPETVLSVRRAGLSTPTLSNPGAIRPNALPTSLALGNTVSSLSSNTTQIGDNLSITGSNNSFGIQIGNTITTNNSGGGLGSAPIYIGTSLTGPSSGGTGVIVIGGNCNFAAGSGSLGSSAIAIGNGINFVGANCVGIGQFNTNRGNDQCVTIGYGNSSDINTNICQLVGSSNSAGFAVNRGVAFGNSNSVSSRSVCVGNDNSAAANGVSIGALATNDFQGQINICNARFANAGDIMTSIVPMYVQTTTAAATELRTGAGTATTAPTGNIACTNFSTYIFDVDIVARSVGSASVAAYNLKFAFNRNANAASSTISSLSKTILFTIGTVTGWDVTATADTTNGRPNVSVTGAASTTINWVGNVRMTKVATAS